MLGIILVSLCTKKTFGLNIKDLHGNMKLKTQQKQHSIRIPYVMLQFHVLF